MRRYTAGDVFLDEECFQLPHQCSEWEIGAPEDARQLITDLQALLRGEGERCRGFWGFGADKRRCTRIALAEYCEQHRP